VSSTWVTILSLIGGVLTSVIGYFGVRLTQRQATKAQRATIALEQSKIDAQAYTEARMTWDALIKDLRNQVKDQRRDLADLNNRLEDLEQKRSGDRRAIHVLTEYARQLLKVINAADLKPPSPPEGLDLEG
jgi:Tfp pilus assembly protein PilN